MARTADIVIVGAGIMGLSLARELNRRDSKLKIVILEKESGLGKHASGRNSGVLHSGIYYPEGSLKAKVCAEGAKELAEYCDVHRLPIKRVGKVIIPMHEREDGQLDLLYKRAKVNGARAEMIDAQDLKKIEPEAFSVSARALYCPDTSVINPLTVLNHIADDLKSRGVEILLNRRVESINSDHSSLKAGGESIQYGYLFNAAGLHADRVAKSFGVGQNYAILPFKGIYYRLSETSGIKVNGHIYPVPDLRVPFLGVHFTKAVNGQVYLGPTAIPALGRENYSGLTGVTLGDAGVILGRLLRQYVLNRQGFRAFVHQEGRRFLKRSFANAAKGLVPNLEPQHLVQSEKVGIRAQLMDVEKKELVMDFLVEKGKNSTHILNAVSPAFTSAFSFSRFVLDHYNK